MMTQGTPSYTNARAASADSVINLRVVCFIIGALALLAPSYVWMNPSSDMIAILAMTWRFDRVGGRMSWMTMDPIMTFASLPFTVWRLVFVYQMVRYYQGRGTRVGTVLLGIFAELPFLMLDLLMRVLSPPTMHLWNPGVTFPTPFMLFAGLVFIWMRPYPVPKTPFVSQSKPDKWWREETDLAVEQRRREYWIGAKSRLKCPRCGSEEIGREMYPGTFGIRARFIYFCRKCGFQWEG
ncbi:MAG: hypothetical protein ACFFD6_05235 [Candidatus Thorarchaeota archaeon]